MLWIFIILDHTLRKKFNTIKSHLIISLVSKHFKIQPIELEKLNSSLPIRAFSRAKLKKRKKKKKVHASQNRWWDVCSTLDPRYWQSYRYRLTVNGRTCRVSWHGTVGNSLIPPIIAVYGSWIPTNACYVYVTYIKTTYPWNRIVCTDF